MFFDVFFHFKHKLQAFGDKVYVQEKHRNKHPTRFPTGNREVRGEMDCAAWYPMTTLQREKKARQRSSIFPVR